MRLAHLFVLSLVGCSVPVGGEAFAPGPGSPCRSHPESPAEAGAPDVGAALATSPDADVSGDAGGWVCGPSTCTGCCEPSVNKCQPGTAYSAYGFGGVVCGVGVYVPPEAAALLPVVEASAPTCAEMACAGCCTDGVCGVCPVPEAAAPEPPDATPTSAVQCGTNVSSKICDCYGDSVACCINVYTCGCAAPGADLNIGGSCVLSK